MSKPKPWDRLPDETAPAFEAFRTYLELGPKRSTAKAAQDLGKSKRTLDGWSSKHQWVRRTAEYDAELARHADQEFFGETRRRARSKAHAQASQVAIAALQRPGARVLERLQRDPNLIDKLTFKEQVALTIAAARVLPHVIRAERLALGMSTENLGDAQGGPLSDARRHVEQMTDQEIEEALADAEAAGATPLRKKTG